MIKIIIDILKTVIPLIPKAVKHVREKREREAAEKKQAAIDAADAMAAGRRVENLMKKAVAIDNAAQHK